MMVLPPEESTYTASEIINTILNLNKSRALVTASIHIGKFRCWFANMFTNVNDADGSCSLIVMAKHKPDDISLLLDTKLNQQLENKGSRYKEKKKKGKNLSF
jgi:hypothetical protein